MSEHVPAQLSTFDADTATLQEQKRRKRSQQVAAYKKARYHTDAEYAAKVREYNRFRYWVQGGKQARHERWMSTDTAQKCVERRAATVDMLRQKFSVPSTGGATQPSQ